MKFNWKLAKQYKKISSWLSLKGLHVDQHDFDIHEAIMSKLPSDPLPFKFTIT